MKTKLRSLLVTLLLTLPGVALAGPIVNQQDFWTYNQTAIGTNFGPNPTFSYSDFTSGFTGANYGQAAFGNANHGSAPFPNTNWDANSALFLRMILIFPGSLVTNIILNVAVDNGAAVFINGTKVFEADAGGYTSAPPPGSWEYANIAIADGLFVDGHNEIAVIANDYGGATYFDMQLTATLVPEPSALLIMAMALMGLGLVRNRRVAFLPA